MKLTKTHYINPSGAKVLLLFILILLTTHCEKIEPERIALVTTTGVSSVSYTSSLAQGTVVDIGHGGITQYGHCWSTGENPTVSDAITNHGSRISTGDFESEIGGLNTGTKYFVRAYLETPDGVIYGENKTFTTATAGVPLIETHEVTSITRFTAVSGGNITADGGSPVAERGVCWNQSGSPEITDNCTHEGSGGGSFASELSDLAESEVYYVRAYATNSFGTGYGIDQVFSTTTFAVVSTGEISDLEPNSVICSGNVLSDGGAEITERGICWGTQANPTLSGSHTIQTGGTGAFSLTVTGLQSGTHYFMRAYAININGNVYGEVIELITPLLDARDNQVYGVVQIGNQYWMTENLNVGEQIGIAVGQSENGVIEKYCYDDNPGNCNIYGGLYTWPEMMQYTTTESTRGVCPSGWHLPSDTEWKTMEKTLGISEGDAELFDWRGTDQGAQLKATGTSLWTSPNNASNTTKFSALPAGYSIEDSDVFSGINDFTTFWTSTEYAESTVIYRLLDHEDTRILRITGYAPNGTPVRCVKD